LYIDEVIDMSLYQNKDIILKEKININNIKESLADFVALGNKKGGTIILGSTYDKISGFTNNQILNIKTELINLINNHIYPNLSYEFNLINLESKFLLVININESLSKPLILNIDNESLIYTRKNNETVGASYDEIINMVKESKNHIIDKNQSGISFDRFEFNKLFDIYYQNNNRRLTYKLLNQINFYDNNKMLKNGSLLFIDENHDIKSRISVIIYKGLTKNVNNIIKANEFNNNIFDSIVNSLEFIKNNMNHSYNDLENKKLIDSYNLEILKTFIIYSYILKGYSFNDDLEINIYDNRLEIVFSKALSGEFDREYNLDVIKKYESNELIYNIFNLINYIDEDSVNKIKNYYLNYELKYHPFIKYKDNKFMFVIPDITNKEGISDDDLIKLNYPPLDNMTKYDDLILSYCYFNHKKVSDIARYLKISNSTYLKNNIVGNLVKNNYLIVDVYKDILYYKTNDKIVKVR